MKRRTKGNGTIRKRSDGRWEGRYTNSLGNTSYIYANTKAEIISKIDELSSIKQLTETGELSGDITMDDYFEHYIRIKKCNIKERSIYQTTICYKRFIQPLLGNRIMYNLSIDDVVAVKKLLQENDFSETYQSNIMTHFGTMINFAFQEGIIKQNPFLYIKVTFNPNQKTIRRALANDEIECLLNEAAACKIKNDNLHLMLCTLLYTGMRVGELCALKWNDFDNSFSSVNIDESRTDTKFEMTTKTPSSVRKIPLNEFLSSNFIELLKTSNPQQIDDYVFYTKRKTPYTSSLVAKRMRDLEAQILTKYQIDLRHITPHYFRHTFATRGLQSGVDIKEMQELLGHADTKTLMSVYLHTNTERKKQSIDKIFNALNSNITTNQYLSIT